MIPQEKIKYFLYARKSSENEDRQVASIPSQIEELKNLAKEKGLTIAAIFTEEKSAKAPNRPVFMDMLQQIHEGKAQGIICWKLDRLARNPVDGGSISWMLQQSVIKHIQSYQRSYYPTDNVLMMNLEFGMANQFILDLSVNTKRGMKSKAQEGWIPHKPPIGYLNNKYQNPEFLPIYKDPERFGLVQKLWRILLEKKCSIQTLYDISLEMGLITNAGKPLNISKFRETFMNPFYYGSFMWGGTLYKGNHEPMLSKEDFDLAQDILSGRKKIRKNNHAFAFTGLIRCGECGASITAEEKIKNQKNGNRHFYTYYRCTKRINPNCSQMPIRDSELETQILNEIDKITIPPEFHQWAIKELQEDMAKEKTEYKNILNGQRKRLDVCMEQLSNLFEMRLNREISAEVYQEKHDKLSAEKEKLEKLIEDTNARAKTWLSRAEKMFEFAENARKRFMTGDLNTKREVLATFGTTLTLTDRTLHIQSEKELVYIKELAPDIRAIHKRLEPLNLPENRAKLELLYVQNPKWGGWSTKVRTYMIAI